MHLLFVRARLRNADVEKDEAVLCARVSVHLCRSASVTVESAGPIASYNFSRLIAQAIS